MLLAVGIAQQAGGAAPSRICRSRRTTLLPTYTPGGLVTYTIVVGTPAGRAVGAKVKDPVTSLSQVLERDVGRASGPAGRRAARTPSSGDIDDTVDIPVGGTVTYTLGVTLALDRDGQSGQHGDGHATLGNDRPGPGPNSATDTNTEATIFYVATDGTDAATCPSTAPCQTIQRAIDIAEAGDTVLVHAGTYHECIVLGAGRSGSAGFAWNRRTSLPPAPSVRTILDGAGACDGVGLNPAAPVAKVFDGSFLIGFA